MNTQFKRPLRAIILLTASIFFILFLLYIPVKYINLTEDKNVQTDLAIRIERIADTLWNFISPILQLTLLLIIVDWLLQKLGIDFGTKEQSLNWNIQTVIAIIVIGAFALAALTNLGAGLSYLKDLSLVVVGFYFGTQKKGVQINDDKQDTKTPKNI